MTTLVAVLGGGAGAAVGTAKTVIALVQNTAILGAVDADPAGRLVADGALEWQIGNASRGFF